MLEVFVPGRETGKENNPNGSKWRTRWERAGGGRRGWWLTPSGQFGPRPQETSRTGPVWVVLAFVVHLEDPRVSTCGYTTMKHGVNTQKAAHMRRYMELEKEVRTWPTCESNSVQRRTGRSVSNSTSASSSNNASRSSNHSKPFRPHAGEPPRVPPTIEARLKISDPLKLRNSSKISGMMSLIFLFTSGSVSSISLFFENNLHFSEIS